MDISCTSKCAHQNDGKCYLYELPSISQVSDAGDKNDCPYFMDKSGEVLSIQG